MKRNKTHVVITATALLYAFLGVQTAHASVLGSIVGALEFPVNGFLMLVIGALNLLARLLSTLMAMLTEFAQFLSEPFITGANNITLNPQITAGWEAMRDVANFLLILVLLVAAILIIARRGSYTVKAVIPKMVTAVLLINFSRLIIGVVLDFFHVVTVGLYQLVVPASSGLNVTEENAMALTFKMFEVDKIVNTIWDKASVTESMLNNIQMFVASLFVIVLVFTIAVSAIMLLALYVMRYVALAVLTVVAPLAMILDVLPFTQKYYKDFWSMLVKYASMSAALAVYLSLALLLSDVFDKMGETVQENAAEGGVANDGAFGEVMPGLPDIEWGTLIKILVIFFLVKKGVEFAKSGSLASGLVDSVQKTANAWGKKPVDKVWGGVKDGAKDAAMFATRPARMAAQNLKTLSTAKLQGMRDKAIRDREGTLIDENKGRAEKLRARAALMFLKSDEDQKKQFESSDAVLRAKDGNIAYAKPAGVAALKDGVQKTMNRFSTPEEQKKYSYDNVEKNNGFIDVNDLFQQIHLASESGHGLAELDTIHKDFTAKALEKVVGKAADMETIKSHLSTISDPAQQAKERTRILESLLKTGQADVGGTKIDKANLLGTAQVMELESKAKRRQTEISNNTKEAALDTMRPMMDAATIRDHLFKDKTGLLHSEKLKGMTEAQRIGAVKAAISVLETAPISPDEKMKLSADIAERVNEMAGAEKQISATSLVKLKGERDIAKLSPHLAAADGTKAKGFTGTNALYDAGFLANITSLSGDDVSGNMDSEEFRKLLAGATTNSTDTVTKDKIARQLASVAIPRDGSALQPSDLTNVFDVIARMSGPDMVANRQNAVEGILRVVNSRPEMRKLFNQMSCQVVAKDAAGAPLFTETVNAREVLDKIGKAVGTYASVPNLEIKVT